MVYEHNVMAHKVEYQLLRQLRNGNAQNWAPSRLTEKTGLWQGIFDWPQPDFAFQDNTKESSLACEFKPPNRNKREYLTGLGQCHAYLNDFEFALLVVPKKANDGYPIAEYLQNIFEETTRPMGLLAYDGNIDSLSTLRRITEPACPRRIIPKGIGRKMFWAYWREWSQYEVFNVLDVMYKNECKFSDAYDHYWRNTLLNGNALTWEKTRRRIPTEGSFASRKCNARLSMRHIKVIDSRTEITENGYNLLHIGKIYNPESDVFKKHLGKLILQDGKHLDLIFWVEENQRVIPSDKKNNAREFRKKLDKTLQENGIIKEVPESGGKETFIRDEFKLWNKLGLLDKEANNRYFYKGEGLRFNWKRILEMAT